MSRRSERNAGDARKVEEALRAEGRSFEAEAVARLRRSLSSMTGTLKILHRDNMELRRQLGLPSYLDERARAASE